MSLLQGRDWIQACRFHDLSEEQVLREVARRVGDVKSKPLVLLDLDSTLYEVGPRTFAILREWLDTPESTEHREVREALGRLRQAEVGYSLKDTFRTLGLSLQEAGTARALEEAKRFWIPRFFSSAYLPHDRAYPGAADFARELYEMGAGLVYLTGRDEPRMGEGTRAILKRDGFPWELDRTHLLLKAHPDLPDLDHKKQAAAYVRAHGSLIASFENEPQNIAALHEIFPEAMHVFVETVYSDHLALPRDGLFRISGFGR